MHRTNIYLEERQTTALDAVARRQGVTRAEVVRRMIDEGLEAVVGDLADDLAVIDASFGVLADAGALPLERGTGSRDEHLARLWRR